MSDQKSINALDPYERKAVHLLEKRGNLKFGEIIMRLGLSATHGQRVLNSLKEKGYIVFQRESRKFRLFQEAE